ncbi:unnamed protein product, partial [marine sediment metagenome]
GKLGAHPIGWLGDTAYRYRCRQHFCWTKIFWISFGVDGTPEHRHIHSILLLLMLGGEGGIRTHEAF